MTFIAKVKLKNFKKFQEYEITLDPIRNILVGDNEAGKSTILTAIELILSGSQSKVKSLGVESLLNSTAVSNFHSGVQTFFDLPIIDIELYLSERNDPALNGKYNSQNIIADGLRLLIEPNEDLITEIQEVLKSPEKNFPFEFYIAKFTTFSREPYSGYRKFLRHISIDSSQINSEYATNQYVKLMYETNVQAPMRYKLKNEYRKQKSIFQEEHLKDINGNLVSYDFAVRSNSKFNLDTDLTLLEQGIPIENRGKGKQCFIKTAFALENRTQEKKIDVLLFEEPENHLSHTNMYKLVSHVENSHSNQILITTHSSLISSKLDLRKTILLNSAARTPAKLTELTEETAKFFMKTSYNNILELVLSEKVILVEGDAEYIMMGCLYKNITGNTLENDGIHLISVGGLRFKRYMEVSKLLNIKTAIITDNDKNFQKNCIDNYKTYLSDCIEVFSDSDDNRSTFEICIYEDNKDLCDELFKKARSTPLQYMLNNKTTAAFTLVDQDPNALNIPDYIQKAIQWIRE